MDITKRKSQQALIRAVALALPIIKEHIGGHLPDDPEIKDDKTLVTVTDRRIEEALVREIHRDFPDVKIIGEEGTETGQGEIGLLIDPLDGTRAFSCGLATSTIIVGVYDFLKKQVVGTVVGEAATGRIWVAFGDSPTRLLGGVNGAIDVSVCPQDLDDQSTIFLDVPHGFTRKGRQIFTDEQMARLFHTLRGRKIAIPGSNGLIQALVANGGQKVAGSITTAIGGPWDVCGVKLVLNAGGSAVAVSIVRDGNESEIVGKDPLDVMNYDLLVCGNNRETVNFLTTHLLLEG